jgi:hypothetical protein|uniref:Uncharacterized protein n=1 Tax=Janibacter sp. TYM3221 TaxID=946335 RepID=L8AZC3_9MICO|nr:hypothetical protein [Janibacter sp. TYM3221]
MIHPDNSHEVLAAIGQDNLNRLGRAVRATRDDLAEYRRALPRLAARHTNRGLLNWIHDQYFANVVATFEEVNDRSIRDKEPIRELYLGSVFRFRFKAHDANDGVSSYPTPAFEQFATQGSLEALQEVRLIAGYRWDKEAGQIEEAVVTLRDGKNDVRWSIVLDEGEELGVSIYTPRDMPDLPSLPTIGGLESTINLPGEQDGT